VLYHGARILLLLGLAVAVTLLFPPVGGTTLQQYTLGSVLDEAVIAEIPFAIPKSSTELEEERRAAASGVPPTFNFRPAAADTMAMRLSRFFDRLDQVAEEGDSPEVAQFLTLSSVSADSAEATLLMSEGNRDLLRQASIRAARELLPRGTYEPGQAQELTADRVLIQDPGAPVRRSQLPSDLLSARQFQDQGVGFLQSTDPTLAGLLRRVVIRHMEYSLVLNVISTEGDRDAARQSVQPMKGQVLENEAVVRANEQIGNAELERLNAYQAALATRGVARVGGVQVIPFLGAALLNLLVLGIYGVLLYFVRSEVYGNYRWVLLQTFLILTYFAAVRVIASNGLPPELLPVAFVALAVAVLWDSRMALVLALVLGTVTFALPEFRTPEVLYSTIVGGAAAAMSVRVVRRRAQTWVFIAIIAAAYAGVLLASALLTGSGPRELGMALVWATLNAAVSAMIAMGFVPVFEWFTGITTDQTLLEWADPNRSLLRRLSLEAPGSYAHTINVANLGELAANAIGANGLLCRVGLYYHDVGKLLKPHYFVENQPEGRNPHDKLKPGVSATIVREHISEGVKLAKEEKLPDVVTDFITEHHGTQLIGYFFSKAQEEDGEDVDEAVFRYPGPRPRSKETAIAMMADSIESATRVLQTPTPERLRNLVDGIVDAKMQDGQLDESPLTLQEIADLKDAFVKVLSSIYHHRIDYPTTKHLTDAEPSETTSEKAPGPEKTAAKEADAEDEQQQMDLGPTGRDR
jgi:putative nucleotidyltransferase with HDIG domain